jgi:hypothetical protein
VKINLIQKTKNNVFNQENFLNSENSIYLNTKYHDYFNKMYIEAQKRVEEEMKMS